MALAGLLMLAKTMAAYTLQNKPQAIPASSPLDIVEEPISVAKAVFTVFV